MDGFATLAEKLAGSRRVLILTGPSRRFVEPALAALAAMHPVVFDGAKVHVPAEVVDAAAARLKAHEADAIVAIGGGSAIGLGKALRLTHDVRFAAVPTTYAGSEMTSMYGITRGQDKQTGRDPRVKPDIVIHDPTLARDMPIALTVQSLLNAFAHVASVMSTGSPPSPAAHDLLRALEDLLIAPRSLGAREAAARAASACAAVFDAGKPGAQHALAHLLGGATGLDHGAIHAALLPQFLAYAHLGALEQAVDRRDLDAYVHDLLVRAGAPVSLAALGATREQIDAALASRPELPAKVALDALTGLRPPGRHGRVELGGAEALVLGCPLDQAARVVLVLHGRGAEAGTVARRFLEIAGHDPRTAIVGLRAPANADRWYAIKYGEPGAGRDPEVQRALARVDRARAALPPVPLVLAGFSQGACLALEYAARHGTGLAAVIAPCGARIGRPDEWPAIPHRAVAARADSPRGDAITDYLDDAGRRDGWPLDGVALPATLAGVPVLLGAAHDDKWIARADLDATAAWLRAAGAEVDVVDAPGDKHEITASQRLRARELILGPHPRGVPGFGSTVEAEALPGALPARQNSPRVPPYDLYAEQLNGTGFTAARADNVRSWIYRVRPGSQRRAFAPLVRGSQGSPSAARVTGTFDAPPMIELTGFAPLAATDGDFVDGLVTLCGAGDARLRRGYAFHRYAANRSMNARALYSADGDLLILPERGELELLTEFGPLHVAPGMLAIIPRGIAFSVLVRGDVRGYVAEPFGRHFKLPERGPIGANGLADARHFRAPAPWYEDRLAPDFRVVGKLGGMLHEASQDHSPFDVVAWHGNYAPVAYDLADFAPVANAAFDHGDPSVYTVVTAPLDEQGAHSLDLVVFPARWDVSANTFRPPFFHRNAVAEINGIVREPGAGTFQPGMVFITPPFTHHGVSGRAVERSRKLAPEVADAPHRHHGSLWFQLESALAPSLAHGEPLEDWPATWGSHRGYFTS